MTDELPYELSEIADLLPEEALTYLPPWADIDEVRRFFALFVEIYFNESCFNVLIGDIMEILDQPTFKNGTDEDKRCAILDFFVQGLLETREAILNPQTSSEDEPEDVPNIDANPERAAILH